MGRSLYIIILEGQKIECLITTIFGVYRVRFEVLEG